MKQVDWAQHYQRYHRALIADVTKPGPAEKAGIEAGDVIVEFDGRAVNQMRDLPRIVAETEVGRQVPVKVLRKGKEMAFTVEVGRLAQHS